MRLIPRTLALMLALMLSLPALAAVQPSQRTDDGLIRVELRSLGARKMLTLVPAGEIAVEANPGFRLRPGAEITLSAMDGGVWMLTGGLMLSLGPSVTLTRHSQDGLYIAESEKRALYNGDLTVSAQEDALRCVLTTGIEEYLCGVVAYEMSDSFPLEALKAQAVAARTYAMQKKAASGSRDYDVTDTTADQVFKGFDPAYENVIAAVESTRGVVGVRGGEFAACYYTASNGGEVLTPSDVWGGSDDGSISRHGDLFDLENPRSRVEAYPLARDLSDAPALKKLLLQPLKENIPGEFEIARVERITPVAPDPAGTRRYTQLQFDLTLRVRAEDPAPSPAPADGRMNFFAFLPTAKPEPVWQEQRASVRLHVFEQIKDGLSLGINRRDYEHVGVSETDGGFSIELRGFGHGTGMSQRGAQWMASEYGKTWIQILTFYYPGMTLEKIDWNAPAREPLAALKAVPFSALPPLEDGERYARVRVDSVLNVREAPSTDSGVLDRLENGRRIILCGEADEHGWVKIRTAERTGYIRMDYAVTE